MPTSDALTEIGILTYPDSQLAAIHGLTDLFAEASRISRQIGGAAAPMLRVTHWRIALDGTEEVECSLDTHGERPALLAVLIAPTDPQRTARAGDEPTSRRMAASPAC